MSKKYIITLLCSVASGGRTMKAASAVMGGQCAFVNKDIAKTVPLRPRRKSRVDNRDLDDTVMR